MPRQKCLGLRLALMRFKRTSGKYQSAAGLHPIRRAVQHRALNRGKIVDRFQVNTLQHIGVPPHCSRGAARRVQQNRIERLRWFPIHDIGVYPLGIQMRAFQIGHQPVHAPRAVIERRYRKASRRKLHRLAPRRSAQIKRTLTSAITQKPRGQAGGQILNPPRAFIIAIKFFDRRATRQTHMAGHQADPI